MIYRFAFALIASAFTMTLSPTIHAQSPQRNKIATTPPVGLEWMPMEMVSFNYGSIPVPTASRAATNLARTIWTKEINSTPIDERDGTLLPSFILVGVVSANGVQYTLSIFSAANARGCIPAANGRGIEDLYKTCPMRVDVYKSGKNYAQEFSGFCHIFPYPPEYKNDINRAEYSFDEKNMTVYFRVIQHGKKIRECDRALSLR